MRTNPPSGPALWPTRICPPWLVASVTGLALGATLLKFIPASPVEQLDTYVAPSPRNAVSEPVPESVDAPAAPEDPPALLLSPATDLATASASPNAEVSPALPAPPATAPLPPAAR